MGFIYSVLTDHLKDNLVIEDKAICQLLQQSTFERIMFELLKCREKETAVLCPLQRPTIQLNVHIFSFLLYFILLITSIQVSRFVNIT